MLYTKVFIFFDGYFSLVSGELRSVRGWFDRVGQLPACTKAVQKILPGKDLNALKNFLQKQPAPHSQRRENLPNEVYYLLSLGAKKRGKSEINKRGGGGGREWDPDCEHVVF